MTAMNSTLTKTAQACGLTVDRAFALADDATPVTAEERIAAPAIRHAVTGTGTVGAPSTPAAWDLGLRIAAADKPNAVSFRLAHSDTFSWFDDGEPVVLTAGSTAGHYTVTHSALPELDDAPIGTVVAAIERFTAPTTPPALIVDKPATIAQALTDARAAIAPNLPSLALLLWWRDASTHRGVGIVTAPIPALRARYATTEPGHERDPHFWADRFSISSTDHQLLIDLSAHARTAPAGPVDAMSQGWISRLSSYKTAARKSYRYLGRETKDHMAALLASEEAHNEWHSAWKIATDPLAAAAARYTGHVVDGTPAPHITGDTFKLVIGNAISRYKDGANVTVYGTDPESFENKAEVTVSADIVSTTMDSNGDQIVELSTHGRPALTRDMTRMWDGGATVTLRPLSPQPSRAARAGIDASRRRAKSTAVSWLSDPKKRPKTRDVPWSVLIAGCE